MDDEKQELTLNDLLEAINAINAKIDAITPQQEEKADETESADTDTNTDDKPTPAPEPVPQEGQEEEEEEEEEEETEEKEDVGNEEEIDKILKDC